jgi:hypothetical protein
LDFFTPAESLLKTCGDVQALYTATHKTLTPQLASLAEKSPNVFGVIFRGGLIKINLSDYNSGIMKTSLLTFFHKASLILHNPFYASHPYILDDGGFAHDAANLAGDWQAIGEDMSVAIQKTYEQQIYSSTR